jgi:hypothetical protein
MDWARRVLASLRPEKRSPEFEIELLPDEFQIHPGHQIRSGQKVVLPWNDVQSITAYKRDLAVYDLICLRVELVNSRSVEVHEEMVNWQAFVDALPAKLTGCAAFGDWFQQVAFPAFSTNETPIYNRVARGTSPNHSMQPTVPLRGPAADIER